MRRVIIALFTIFVLLPALFFWLKGYDLWLQQIFSLLLWNVGSFIILRVLPRNSPSEKQMKIQGSSSVIFYYLLFISYANKEVAQLFSFLSVDKLAIIAILSLFTWLIPTKIAGEKTQKEPFLFSLDALFLVPKQAKLIFSVLSSLRFTATLALLFLVILGSAVLSYYQSKDFLYLSIFFIGLQYQNWLKEREKLASLLFLVNAPKQNFEKIVYRAFFHINLYFLCIMIILIYLVSPFLPFEITFSALLLMFLSVQSGLYILLRLPMILNTAVLMLLYSLVVFYINNDTDMLLFMSAGLALFVIWTFIYPATNWLRDDNGVLQLRSVSS